MGLLQDGKLNKEENGRLGLFYKGLQMPATLHRNSALQKTILACLLVLAISVTLSRAQCFFQPMKPDEGCRDSDGVLRKFGSSWRNADCYDCSCSRDGIDCCASFGTPVGFDEKKCEKIFNKETCTYKVVEKDDPSKECPFNAVVA
nr:PREDICTED: beta-microseminoprotein-like [Phalacrocorax carbo]